VRALTPLGPFALPARWLGGFAVLALAGCTAPAPVSMTLSEVVLINNTGATTVRFVITPRDDAGQPMEARGAATARILEGGSGVCEITGGGGPRIFTGAVGYEELFAAPCTAPAAGPPARSLEVTLVGDGFQLVAVAPLPADTSWVTDEAVAVDREGRAAAAAAAPVHRTTSEVGLERLGAYVDSIARAVAAVPEEGTGGAESCATSMPLAAPTGGVHDAPHGRLLHEDWARRVAAASDRAQLPPASTSGDAAFVTSPAMSRGVAFLARLVGDPSAFDDDESTLGRALRPLYEDGDHLAIVRVLRMTKPVVERVDARNYVFDSGQFAAIVFIVDREEGKLLCASPVTAVNSAVVDFGPAYGSSTTDAAHGIVLGDLQLQATTQLKQVRAR